MIVQIRYINEERTYTPSIATKHTHPLAPSISFEPIFFANLQIYFADFPYQLSTRNERLLILGAWGGSRYGEELVYIPLNSSFQGASTKSRMVASATILLGRTLASQHDVYSTVYVRRE